MYYASCNNLPGTGLQSVLFFYIFLKLVNIPTTESCSHFKLVIINTSYMCWLKQLLTNYLCTEWKFWFLSLALWLNCPNYPRFTIKWYVVTHISVMQMIYTSFKKWNWRRGTVFGGCQVCTANLMQSIQLKPRSGEHRAQRREELSNT